MVRKITPEIIKLPDAKLDEIKTRFEEGTSLEEDKKVILLILSTYSWLSRQLRAKKLGIQRLRNLFGFSTEKRPDDKRKDNENVPADLGDPFDTSSQQENMLAGNEATPIKKPLSGIQRKTMDD